MSKETKINPIIKSMYYDMIYRCTKKNNASYKNYGGRGIKVCDEWLTSRKSFFDFVIENGYEDGLSIDRINNDGDYEPSNVRFVTMKENCRNKRNNRHITINKETKTLAEWVEISGVSSVTITDKIKKGYTGEDILKPVNKYKAITIYGVTKTYKQWADKIGVSSDTFKNRVNRGFSPEKLLKPYKKPKKPLLNCGPQSRSGERNGMARLTNTDIITIRALAKNGTSCKYIALGFGVCRCSIYGIISRRSWRHVI